MTQLEAALHLELFLGGPVKSVHNGVIKGLL